MLIEAVVRDSQKIPAQTCSVKCREVALAVAAAVALSASESMVASSTGTDVLSCLPLDKAADDPSALRQAEECIGRIRYDPFAAEVTLPGQPS